MSVETPTIEEMTETQPPLVPARDILLTLLTVVAGVLLAVNLAPLWLPALSSSATNSEPKIFWFLSRASAIVAYWILWLTLALGISITNKMAQIWPGIPPAYELHQYTSLLGLAFGFFHALILMGDQYIHFSLVQVLVPFTSQEYRPVWVGIGQVSFYLWVVVAGSFYVRKRIGKKAWRLIHFASYASFLGILVHGIFSGTDTASVLMKGLYWASGAALLFLTVYRVLVTRLPVEQPARPRRVA